MRVYVAGPLTEGERGWNVRRAVLAGTKLLDAGHEPFVPHLSELWDILSPRPYETWMRWCLAWVAQCQALVRLSGKSDGARREEHLARDLGIPVYWSVEDFLADIEQDAGDPQEESLTDSERNPTINER